VKKNVPAEVFSKIPGASGGNPLPESETNSSVQAGNYFTDGRDGKKYRTVKIGKQVWMAENLNYEYAFGDPDFALLSLQYVNGYGTYEDNEANGNKYGKLYNWFMVDKGKISPPGWHIPTWSEWETLISFAGGWNVAGLKLKAKSGWKNSQTKSGNGSDTYGFMALPGGRKDVYILKCEGEEDEDIEKFADIGCECRFWSATKYNNNDNEAPSITIDYYYDCQMPR